MGEVVEDCVVVAGRAGEHAGQAVGDVQAVQGQAVRDALVVEGV